MIDVYRRVISQTTDWMNEDGYEGGPVGRLIAHTVETSDAVTLLTFNQDLVLENEIYKRARLRPLWCVEHGYGAVPPVYNKQTLIRRFIPQVWEDAEDVLLKCDRLVFFGYSLPPTDIEAEKLFQRSIFANEELKTVDVINPDPDAAARYARLVPNRPLRWFPDVFSLWS